ncbi:MAG TPA: hypothetical protein VHM30_19735 [Gemmatimonadaceae bacterium]|nr:hypothetical protein [Gemmatimonadaceae bacterium]
MIGTAFFQMRENDLLTRAAQIVGCVPDPDEAEPCAGAGGWFGWYATADDMRRAQRLWKTYLTLYRAEHHPSRPALRRAAVGCYELRLLPSLSDPGAVDTSQRFRFALDTLPLPGTVRSAPLALAPGLTVGPGAKWSAHYESRILVSWDGPDGVRLLVNFGGSDAAIAGYVLWRPKSERREIFGRVEVSPLACR